MFVGGGTGGHFYPLIAVVERLNLTVPADTAYKHFYIGPDKYSEEDLVRNNIEFVYTSAGKTRRYFSLLNYLDPFKTLYGFFVSVWLLYKIYPDVLFSKGGHTSVPVVLAAAFLRIPIVIHESDSKPGRANKLAAKFARYIAISFEAVAQYFPEKKTALTGIPVRLSFMHTVSNPHAELGIPTTHPVLFVTGGSSGAMRINDLILKSLNVLLPQFTIIHQTGTDHATTVESSAANLVNDQELLQRYFIRGSLGGREMDLAQSAATVIVSRAGAGTIFEIARKGKPSILIPIPEDISHDQRSNAYEYARTGAALVIEEKNMVDDLLIAELHRIIDDEQYYRAMSEAALQFAKDDAAEEIAAVLTSIANEHA